MGAAYFYHLTRSPLEATLPMLLGKARAAGWRVAVRGRDPVRMARLDERLWLLGKDTDFPAHGLAGGPHDARQPVLLCVGDRADNAPDCVICVDGAEIDPEEVRALARVCVLFDGNDEAAVQAARLQWKALAGAGCSAKYWSEASGRWQMEAQTGA